MLSFESTVHPWRHSAHGDDDHYGAAVEMEIMTDSLVRDLKHSVDIIVGGIGA